MRWFEPKLPRGACIPLAGALALLLACERADPSPAPSGPSARPAIPAASASAAPASRAPVPPKGCPAGSALVKGGSFTVGTSSTDAPEESPRFTTRIADFCMDVTEVTLAAFRACSDAEACEPARADRRFCNARLAGRDDHPVNCVDYRQASAYCAWRKLRLPTEVEWEYAARGGNEYRRYSWGDASPDGRACWKHVGGSCKVRSFDAGAFGLYDMIGNVWEWTSSGFGPYPWPAAEGAALTRVYRGGSWSRRFEKWMSPKLRNRYREREWGSHLGFRCAVTAPGAECAYGKAEDGSCLFGVDSVDCPSGQSWNGARCARKGEPRCPSGRVEKPGSGCVLAEPARGAGPETESTPVTRARQPSFDADCAQFQRGRPHAYRFTGGTHDARNRAGSALGCKNRDVGIGWNSSCCP